MAPPRVLHRIRKPLHLSVPGCYNLVLWVVLGTIYHLQRHRTRGGGMHMKEVGMFVVSLRGVNFGLSSHLGCSGQNTIICEAVKVSLRVSREEI